MEPALHFISVSSAFLFSGAAIYISLVEHPARMSCGLEVAATEFAASYRRAVPVQVSLAVVATASGVASWWFSGNANWLIGALLMFSVIPFTVLVIAPTQCYQSCRIVPVPGAHYRRLAARLQADSASLDLYN